MYFLKTYIYPGPFGPLRGVLRNTFLAPSRVAREWRALAHLAAAGVQPALGVDRDERRTLGFLREARIMTRSFGTEDLETRLAREPLSRAELTRLASFVKAAHDSGLRDPDLVARNLLLDGQGGDLELAKIDSSTATFTRRNRWDRRRVRDLDVLLTDLDRLGVPARQRARLLASQWFPGRRPLSVTAAAARAAASPALR